MLYRRGFIPDSSGFSLDIPGPPHYNSQDFTGLQLNVRRHRPGPCRGSGGPIL